MDIRRSSIRQPNGHRRDRRTTLAAAVSVVLHLALFGYLAQVVPMLRTPQYVTQPDVQLDLTSLPAGSVATPPPVSSPRRTRTLPQSAPRSALVATPRRAALNAPSPRAAVTPSPSPRRPAAAATASNPAAGSPSATTAAGPPAARTSQDAGEEDARGGVRAFLRATVGCSHEDFANLTAKERAACAVRLARDARAIQDARVDPLSGRDRTYFDALRDADQAARNRRMPGYDCSLMGRPQDAGGCALQGGGAGTQGLNATHP